MTSPGLDINQLRALQRSRRDLGLLQGRIRRHIDEHEGYVAFSGGKDSLVVLDLARQVDPDVPVAFFDSGLEFPETYTYIAQVADRWRLNLHVIPAAVPALQILAGNGGWDHHAATSEVPNLHHVLIRIPVAQAHRRFGPGELWGVRAQESRGRAAAYANALRAARCHCTPPCPTQTRRTRHGGLISRVDGTVAYGPVWDWHTDEIWAYTARHQLPVNPVYDKLRRLGAPEQSLRVATLVDGSRLEEGRITWLRRGWPALFEELANALPRLREYV